LGLAIIEGPSGVIVFTPVMEVTSSEARIYLLEGSAMKVEAPIKLEIAEIVTESEGLSLGSRVRSHI
jgi:hypothetical protein